jgi:transposase-like protein
MIRQFGSLMELMETFADEQTAIDHFTAIRWSGGAFCPYCGGKRIYHFADKRTHKCGECRQRFSIKVGTIFHDTKIQLRKWFAAIWLITSHRKGVASAQLARDIHVTQKTAWFMLHRLREAARTNSFNRPLTGDVEADESRFGGKEKNWSHARKAAREKLGGQNKPILFGILKRGGEVRVKRVPDVQRLTLLREIGHNVRRGSTIHTDEHYGYVGLEGRGYRHTTVRHVDGEYATDDGRGVQGVEGFWSLLKRAIVGIYHAVSPKHLDRYAEMAAFRYNTRGGPEDTRVNLLLARADARRLSYKMLIA